MSQLSSKALDANSKKRKSASLLFSGLTTLGGALALISDVGAAHQRIFIKFSQINAWRSASGRPHSSEDIVQKTRKQQDCISSLQALSLPMLVSLSGDNMADEITVDAYNLKYQGIQICGYACSPPRTLAQTTSKNEISNIRVAGSLSMLQCSTQKPKIHPFCVRHHGCWVYRRRDSSGPTAGSVRH